MAKAINSGVTKKLMAVMMCVIFVFGLCSCGEKDESMISEDQQTWQFTPWGQDAGFSSDGNRPPRNRDFEMTSSGEMPPDMQNQNLPQRGRDRQMPSDGDFTRPTPPDGGGGFPPGERGPGGRGGNAPDGRFGNAGNDFATNDAVNTNESSTDTFWQKYSAGVISMLLLAGAFVFVIFYKRNKF